MYSPLTSKDLCLCLGRDFAIRVDVIKTSIYHLTFYRSLPKMNHKIEIAMLKLVYTEYSKMFAHSGNELRRFENFVFLKYLTGNGISAQIPVESILERQNFQNTVPRALNAQIS